jgi:uncharacterized protein
LSELICDTTVIQYLHQIGLLSLLPALASQVIVPAAVADELAVGLVREIELPEVQALGWAHVLSPNAKPSLPDSGDLGAGELEVLWLACERPGSVAVLDDSKARQVATAMNVPFTGTLGLLLDAKRAGLVSTIAPYVDELRQRNFHLSLRARAAILHEAGEGP